MAQIEEFFHGAADGIEHCFRVALPEAVPVVIEGLWAEFVSPDPVARSVILVEGALTPGIHEIAIPDEVPIEGSYVTVRIGDHVSALQIGEKPTAVTRFASTRSLPDPSPVSTQLPWE